MEQALAQLEHFSKPRCYLLSTYARQPQKLSLQPGPRDVEGQLQPILTALRVPSFPSFPLFPLLPSVKKFSGSSFGCMLATALQQKVTKTKKNKRLRRQRTGGLGAPTVMPGK
jgi:hypothetical protein